MFDMLELMATSEQRPETDAEYFVIEFTEAKGQMPIGAPLLCCHSPRLSQRYDAAAVEQHGGHDLQLRASCVQRRLAPPQQVFGRPNPFSARVESWKAQFSLQNHLGVTGARLHTHLGHSAPW